MFRQWSLLLMLCVCLVGCQFAPSFTKWSGHPERHESDKRRSMDDLREIEDMMVLNPAGGAIGVDFDFNVNDSIEPKQTADTLRSSFVMSDEIRQEIDRMEHKFLREQIVATPRGSQVGIHDESGGRYSGTVLRAGPDHVDMMNCISQEAIPGPAGQQQCKTSHIPLLTVQTSAVTHFVTVSPPPPGFPATDDEIDGTEYSVAEIVNRSGQRQRWGKAPVMGDSNRGTASLNLE